MAFPHDPALDALESEACPQDVIVAIGAHVPFNAGAEVFSRGEPTDFIYQLLRGAVRLTEGPGRLRRDELCEPGDLFGLEPGPEHLTDAVALSDCVVLVVSRRGLALVLGEAMLEALVAPELAWGDGGQALVH